MESNFLVAGTATSSVSVRRQFSDLIAALESHHFKAVENLPAKYLIAVNHNPSVYKKFLQVGGKPQNTVLIMLEPLAVYPAQYKKRIQRKYSLVLAPGNPRFSTSKNGFVAWPYEVLPNPLLPTGQSPKLDEVVRENTILGLFDYINWSTRSKFLVMINANKVSPTSAENYSLRRKIAAAIPGSHLSVYGALWNAPIHKLLRERIAVTWFSIKGGYLPNLWHVYGDLHKRYPNAYGTVDDKQALLRNSKFSIVIENDSNYLSEKIFDSLINGCIPIYLGTLPPDLFLPKNIFIPLDCRPDEIVNKLDSLSDAIIREYLSSTQDFLSSPNFFMNWAKSDVFKLIANQITEHFAAQNA